MENLQKENSKPTTEKKEAANRGHYELRNVNIKAFGDILNSLNKNHILFAFSFNHIVMLEL